MTIIKNKLDGNYSIVPNNIINDPYLSFYAFALLVKMRDKPANWQFSVENLAKEYKSLCGIDKIKKTLKELELAGYLERNPIRNQGGQFTGWEWIIYDKRCIKKTAKALKSCLKNTAKGKTPLAVDATDNSNIERDTKSSSSINSPETFSENLDHEDPNIDENEKRDNIFNQIIHLLASETELKQKSRDWRVYAEEKTVEYINRYPYNLSVADGFRYVVQGINYSMRLKNAT